jgi:hypothetical protein
VGFVFFRVPLTVGSRVFASARLTLVALFPLVVILAELSEVGSSPVCGFLLATFFTLVQVTISHTGMLVEHRSRLDDLAPDTRFFISA